MKKVNVLSLVACGVLLSSSMAFGASKIDSAFKEGKVSGSLALYGEKHNKSNNTPDSGFGNANATVAYETGSLDGFTAKAEFKGNLGLGEIEKYDRRDGAPFENNALITEAYAKYANDVFFVSAGRQAIEKLEWLGDYHEAVVAGITAIPDTVVVVGYTQRKAESGINLSEDFHEFNGNKGAYVLDVKYAGLKGVEFNPYYYSAPDVANWYGLKTTFTADMFGAVAHYAVSNEDSNKNGAQSDGSIGHLELNTTIEDFKAAVGYIKTDKDVGAGSMLAAEGDHINPFDTGLSVYDPNAKTVYGSVGYTIASVELGALYGETKYGTDYKETELNLTAKYPITEALTAKILYGDVNADEAGEATKGSKASADDKYVFASVEYKF